MKEGFARPVPRLRIKGWWNLLAVLRALAGVCLQGLR